MTFTPDYAVPPGATLLDHIKERKLDVPTFCRQYKLDTGLIQQVITGKAVVTEEIAADLALATGSSKDFWIRRENHYRQQLAILRPVPVALTKG